MCKEFTPYWHFQFVKGIFEGTIRVQDIDFSQHLSQIDKSRRLWFCRDDEFDPRPRLQTLERHAHGLDFFNAIVGAQILVPRQFDWRRLVGNSVQRVEGRSDSEPFVGTDPRCFWTEGSVVNETPGFVDDE